MLWIKPMDTTEPIEWHLIFNGDVQGVGFRATAYQIANNLGLVGSAQNLKDGTVEVFVQGHRKDLVCFLERIQAVFDGYIQDIKTQENPPNPDKTYFIIINT
jgi:acylphosphatase